MILFWRLPGCIYNSSKSAQIVSGSSLKSSIQALILSGLTHTVRFSGLVQEKQKFTGTANLHLFRQVLVNRHSFGNQSHFNVGRANRFFQAGKITDKNQRAQHTHQTTD